MRLAVCIKTVSGTTHEVELDGPDTVKDLYSKAAEVAAVDEGAFALHLEGEVLDKHARGQEEVQLLGMEQGCELVMQLRTDVMWVSVLDLRERLAEIALRVKEDPNLVLVVGVVDGVSTLQLWKDMLPRGLRHLRVADPDGRITRIEENFLSWCDLATVDLTELQSVKSVGPCFLNRCGSLLSVDLTPFQNVSEVGHHFLANCGALKHIDLTPLKKVTVIGSNFMTNCVSLKPLNLRHLKSLRSVGDNFLGHCFHSIDTSQLPPVSRGRDFCALLEDLA